MSQMPDILRSPEVVGFAQYGGLVACRLLPMIAFTPLWGGSAAPRQLKAALVVLLTASFCAAGGAGQSPVAAGRFIALLAKESLVGLMLGVATSAAFQGLAAAGAAIDVARGTTLSSVFDPLRGNQNSPLSAFYDLLGTALFLSAGGYRFLVLALADSFIAFSPYTMLPSGAVGAGGIEQSAAIGAHVLLMALRWAAPVLVVILLVDLSLGLVGRLAPQIEVFFIGMQIKGTLGILLVLLGLALVAGAGMDEIVQRLRAAFAGVGH